MYRLNIDGQPLATALNTFAQQSGLQVVYFTTVAEGIRANSVTGNFTIDMAMCQLLAGSGIGFEHIDDATIAIRVDSGVKAGSVACEHAIDARSSQTQRRASTAVNAVIDNKQTELEEVIVTAQKRIEVQQKAPVSLASMSGRAVAGGGVKSIYDLQSSVPGLQVVPSRNAANIYIRGVGSDHTGESSTLSVSYSVDGVAMARAAASTGLLYDLVRVEVIRGPQSTLYGTNAIAGGVNVITHQPDSEFAASAALDLGNYGMENLAGVINLPLNQSVALRVAAQQVRHYGFTDNSPAKDANDQNDVAGRATLKWDVSSDLSATTSVDHYRSQGVGGLAVPLDQDPRRYALPESQYIHGDHQNYGASLHLDWNQAFGQLTYIGGLREDEWTDQFLGTGSPDRVSSHHNHQASHELRVANETGALHWLLGAFYMRESTGLNDLSGSSFVRGSQYAESRALFAQTIWSFTKTTRLTAGLRYTFDSKGENTENSLGPLGVVNNRADVHWRYPNFKLGVDHDVTPTWMIYGSLADGSKAGGYNASAYSLRPTFGPERLLGIELGSKGRWLNNRVELNVAGFVYRYYDFHATYRLPCGCATDTINAQRATSRGIEIESAWLPTDVDRVDLSVNYLDAFYNQFVIPGGDYSGYPLAHAPHWTTNLSYRHVFEMDRWRWVPRINLHSESAQSMTYDRAYVQKAFVLANIGMTFVAPEDRWSVQLYVHNARDEIVVRGYSSGSGYLGPPRQYGIRFEARL